MAARTTSSATSIALRHRPGLGPGDGRDRHIGDHLQSERCAELRARLRADQPKGEQRQGDRREAGAEQRGDLEPALVRVAKRFEHGRPHAARGPKRMTAHRRGRAPR